MDVAQRSLMLFNQGVAEKRAGNYSKALELQKESIRIYPDDPDIMSAYYAMGKVYYLVGNYKYSLLCYLVYNNLCLIKNPPILSDYKLLLNGDIAAKYRLIPAFTNLAHNVGHTLMDPDMEGRQNEIQWYAYDVAGKHPENMASMAVYRSAAEKYDAEVTDNGFNVVFSWFDKFLQNPQKVQMDTVAVMEGLLA